MADQNRNWGWFSLPVDIMKDHPMLIEAVMMPLAIESVIFNGKKDTFDFVVGSPFFEPVPDGELPPEHLFIFDVEDHPLGKMVRVSIKRL